MTYRAYATRSKTDSKRVLVYEGKVHPDLGVLRSMLIQKSTEFDERTKIKVVYD